MKGAEPFGPRPHSLDSGDSYMADSTLLKHIKKLGAGFADKTEKKEAHRPTCCAKLKTLLSAQDQKEQPHPKPTKGA